MGWGKSPAAGWLLPGDPGDPPVGGVAPLLPVLGEPELLLDGLWLELELELGLELELELELELDGGDEALGEGGVGVEGFDGVLALGQPVSRTTALAAVMSRNAVGIRTFIKVASSLAGGNFKLGIIPHHDPPCLRFKGPYQTLYPHRHTVTEG